MTAILWTGWWIIFLFLKVMALSGIFREIIRSTAKRVRSRASPSASLRRPQESEPVNTVPKLRDVEGRQSIARGHQSSTVKRQFSFKEKREFEQLEKEIPLLVAEKESVTEKLNSGSTPFGELQQLSVRIIEITRLLDEKEMRWLELSELQ